MKTIYKRVLLKISGEALSGEKGYGIDPDMTLKVAKEIKKLQDLGVEVAIVCGGGNFWRGRTSGDMDKVTADYMGMLATIMNSMALQDYLESIGAKAVTMTSLEVKEVAEPFNKKNAVKHLKNKEIVIFGGGTGNPLFTTDTAAALRACEIEADVILLAKNIDYVYDKDPGKNPDAKPLYELSFMDIIDKDLKVMDLTAATLCKDNNIMIHVFGLKGEGNILKAVSGEKIGTIVK